DAQFTTNYDPQSVFEGENTLPSPKVGSPVQFTDSSAGTGTLTRKWDFGDGNKSTLTNPAHTYANPGMKIVTLDVTDSSGRQSRAVEVLNVHAASADMPPEIDMLLGNPSSPRTGEPVTLTTSARDPDDPGAPLTYDWNWGDGSAHGTTATPSPHTYTTAGAHVVTLTVTDASGSVTRAWVVSSHTANQAPSIFTGVSLTTAGTGQPVSFDWFASDPEND